MTCPLVISSPSRPTHTTSTKKSKRCSNKIWTPFTLAWSVVAESGSIPRPIERQRVGRRESQSGHLPLCLEIHSETPEEIAVSILAEMIKIHRGKSECINFGCRASTRMGFQSRLALGSRHSSERSGQDVRGLQAETIVVVYGRDQPKALNVVEQLSWVHHSNWYKGMRSSIRCGLSHAMTRECSSETFIHPVDCPGVNPILSKAQNAQTGWSACPTYDGRRGHPIKVSSGPAKRLLSLDTTPLHEFVNDQRTVFVPSMTRQSFEI